MRWGGWCSARTAASMVGAQPLSMADKSAGVMVNVTLHPGGGGRAGRFGSAWPRGGAGDVVRWAYRERFSGGEWAGWVSGSLAGRGAAAGGAAAGDRGGGRLFGWCYFDERDWCSRRAALSPVRVGSGVCGLGAEWRVPAGCGAGSGPGDGEDHR